MTIRDRMGRAEDYVLGLMNETERKHPGSHAGERRARDVELSYDAGERVQAAC